MTARAPSTSRRPSARKELLESITKVRLTYLYVECQLTVPQIAKRYSVSEPTIKDRLKAHGIPMRPRGKKLDLW